MNFGFGTRLQPEPFAFRSDSPKWKQVHGVAVAEVTHASQDCGEVDAIWTRLPDFSIAVKTADCVPILLSHRSQNAIAAIHAGWRGIEAKIVESFFQALPEDLARPEDWNVWIGPSIHACCYQVSQELIEQFQKCFSEMSQTLIEPAPRMLDLIAITELSCRNLGISIELVHPDCTYCTRTETGDLKYLSYRRGDRHSRQFSMIKI